jgi:Uma2 family endonuclease
MSHASGLVTAEELERFPDDDYRYELVEGRLIRMSPVGGEHGRIVVHVLTVLHLHARQERLGIVFTEVGFKLASNPDTVRAPDIAFVRQDRVPSPMPRGFLSGPPDLAIEVLSPDDRASDVSSKVDEYLGHGCSLVVVIDPGKRSVTSYRRLAAPLTVAAFDDVVDVGDVVPGFSLRARDIFE